MSSEPRKSSSDANDPPRGLAHPRAVRLIVKTLVAVCALLLLADLAYHKHSEFAFEQWFGFFPLFGFAAYCFIVAAAKQLRSLVMRDEDYYD